MLLLIVVLQSINFLFKTAVFPIAGTSFAVDLDTQEHIDELKKARSEKDIPKHYPFNPNYISDFKGYTLGMSPAEIDRLMDYRAQNKFVYTKEGFQQVTGVSDSLLETMSPYFRFPHWTRKNSGLSAGSSKQNHIKAVAHRHLDLNSATAEDLKTIYGIGEKLSVRIIKFRDALGGFLINEQLNDVYGLKPEVVKNILKKFSVLEKPKVESINLNKASARELSSLVYINYDLAIEIIDRRTQVGGFSSFNELKQIENFPGEKIDRIALYLRL